MSAWIDCSTLNDRQMIAAAAQRRYVCYHSTERLTSFVVATLVAWKPARRCARLEFNSGLRASVPMSTITHVADFDAVTT